MGGLITKPNATMSDLNLLIKSASKAIGQTRPPINRFTFPMLKSDKSTHPLLKLKAAESRYMLPVLLHILEMYFPMDTDHKRVRHRCVQKICQFYVMMKLPEEIFDGVACGKLAREHLLLYADLSR